jgi:hypothetical protein
MITLAKDLAQHFYAYWQFCDYQAVLIIPVKKIISSFFLDEIILKGHIFILDSSRQIKTDESYAHTHTHTHTLIQQLF